MLIAACSAAPDELLTPLVPQVYELDDPAPFTSTDLVEATPLPVVTYEGSGEMVHPDALVFPRDWHGSRFWYAATPYPAGNPEFENPSGFVGNTSDEWGAIPGSRNPLATPAEGSYLSDPDLSYDPVKDEIRMYYRQTKLDKDEVLLTTSHQGYAWSAPVVVLQDSRYALISPAIVREADGSWRMWTVNAEIGGCKSHVPYLKLNQRRSRDGITWGGVEDVRLTIPKYVPWHWDVQYIPARREYWALIAAFPDGADCSRSAVYFARSADGTSWSVSPAPLLATGAFEPMRDVVYRSSFRYFSNEDAVTVWFSGGRAENGRFKYSMAAARYPLQEMLRRVNGPGAMSQSRIPAHDDGELARARARFVEAFP